MTTKAKWIHAGDETRPARRADAGVGKRLRIAHAFASQGVEVRSDGKRVAVGTEERTRIFAGNPEDVGAFGSCGNPQRGDQQQHGKPGGECHDSAVKVERGFFNAILTQSTPRGSAAAGEPTFVRAHANPKFITRVERG
jgi:hypothetical protein